MAIVGSPKRNTKFDREGKIEKLKDFKAYLL